VCVQGNPITSPPAEVIEKGAVAIKDFLQKFIYAQKSKVLNFNNLGITELPAEIWCSVYLLY
jgi:hypothetical protein